MQALVPGLVRNPAEYTMAKKIYGIVSWSLLVVAFVCIFLVLRKPSLPPVEATAEAARSFDQKLSQLREAHRHGAPQEIRITEAELNSKLQESLQSREASGGPATLKAAAIYLQGDRLQGVFTVNVRVIDVYVTLGANLAASNGTLEFTPTDIRMGSLSVPLAVVKHTLRERLDSAEMRERMKLPESIKDVRIENGELVLRTQ